MQRESPSEGYDDIGEGWITFVQQLRFALTRHRGEARATHYLSSDVPLELLAALEAMGARGGSGPSTSSASSSQGSATGCSSRSRSRGPPFLTLSAYGEAAATLPLHTARWDGWWAELASM